MSERVYLTEQEKIKIIAMVYVYGHQWKMISETIGHPYETVRSFYKSYIKHDTILPKQGRPIKIDNNLQDQVVKKMEENPTNTLRNVANELPLSPTSVRNILNQNHIQFFQQIAVCPLSPTHVGNRVNFCNNMLNALPQNIIFTDESSVEVNLKGHGIWRKRGLYPPGSFYEKTAHPLHIMVWGGIGPRGFRTPLVRFDKHVNSKTYIEALLQHNIVGIIRSIFGNNWCWQQDNAPAHNAFNSRYVLSRIMPNMLNWPAKSPDLSPIEQVWDYIKKRLEGQNFDSVDQLFNAIQKEWNEIPNQILHNFYSSFLARCQVCLNKNGQSLNGSWSEVHHIHDTYRTNLYYITDPQTNITYVGDH